jgi:hypothetical protein
LTTLEYHARDVGRLPVEAVNMINVIAVMSRQNTTRKEPLGSQEQQEREVTTHIDPGKWLILAQ